MYRFKDRMGFKIYLCFLLIGGSSEHTANRIIGGYEVDIRQFPYQVSLSYKEKHMCGGSIINEYFILTAAHCMHNVRIEYLKVRLGSTYSDRGGYMVGVANEFIHPEFDIATLDYDIAVLKLERALTFTETIQPINLPKQGDIIFSLYAYPIVTGWGRRNRSNSELSLHLIALEVPLLTKTMCQQLKGYKNINDRMICAGYVEGGKDSCIGDGGGPLVIGDVQIGIASWGMDCAQPRSPGVYAALPTLRYFIDEVLTFAANN